MPHERVTNNRQRRAEKRRTEVTVRADTASITADFSGSDEPPAHLQGVKEHYEIAVTADEAQKRKRVKAQGTIGTMTVVTTDVALGINANVVGSINEINAVPMRADQRERITEVVDEIADIGYAALQDGLEESTMIVNQIADTDPRTHKKSEQEYVIELTAKERLAGKARIRK